MAGSSLSSDPLTSPSPSPSPPPGTTKPTESSGAGLDSDSELSELTEEEQEAQKRKVKQGARPVRQLARQTLLRNRTQRRAGGRRKTSSLVPTPMWGWAESKASNTAEEEEEEEDDEEEAGSVNGPPKVLEEEEDENEHDIDEDEEEDGSVVTPRSGAAKRLVPENDPTNHNDDERREDDERESRGVNGVDDDDASEDETPVHRIAQKPKPNPPWGTRPRAPFSAQQQSHHSQSLVNGQSDAVPSEGTAFGSGDHEPDADERENDDDGSDADPDAADEAPMRGGSESENGVESEEEEEDSKGIRADDDEPDGEAPPASAKTKASKLSSQSTDVLVDMDVDVTAPAPQDIAPLTAAAAASSIMAGSAVLDPPSPSATSASGSPASSRSASPVPSAKVSDREGGNEKTAGRPKRDAKSGTKMEEDASHAAIPASAKGNAIAAVNNEAEVEPERSVVDEAELDEHSPDDDLEVEIESDLQPAHRAEALDVLATIELKFALLRERVYVEKMEGLAWEEQLIGEGTHPEMIHLQKELSKRRDKRLELAARKRAYELGTVAKRRRADDDATWSWWKLARDELQTDMISETNRKRRKLERERRAVERPLPLRRLPNIPQEVPPPPSLRKIARTFPPDHRRQNKHHLGANHLTYPELSTLSAVEVASDLDFLLQPRDRRPAYDLHHSSSMNINPQLSQQPPHPQAYEQYNDGVMQNSYGSSATHRMPPPPFQQHHVPPPAPPMPGYPSYNGPPPQGRMHQPSHVPQPPPLHGHVHHHGQPLHSIDQDVGAMPGSSQAPAHPYFGSQGGTGQGGYPGGPPPPPAPSHAMGRPISPVMTNGSTGKMRGMPGFGGAMTTLYAIRRNAGDRGRDGRRPPDMVADEERDEAYWAQERRWLVEESEKEREREWEREMERRDRENREREREEEMERQRQYHNHQQQQLSQQQQQPHRHAPPSSHHHHPMGPGQPSHHHLNPHMHHRSQPHHHHVVHHHHGHPQSGNSIGHGSSSLPPNGPGSGVPQSPRGSRDYDIARPHSHAGVNQHPTEVINLSSSSKSSLWKGDEHSPPSGDYRDGRKHPARPSSGPVLDDRDRPMAIPFALGPSPHSMPGSGMSPPTGPAVNGTSSPRSAWNPSTDEGPYRMPPNAPGSAGPHSYLGSHEGHVHSPGQRYASAAPSSSHMNRGPPPPSSRQNSLGLSPPRGRPMHPPSPSSSSAYPNSTNSHHSPTRYGQSPSLLPPNRSPPVSLKMRPPSPLSNKMLGGPPPPPPLSSSSSAGPAFSPHLSGPGRTLTPTGVGPQQPAPPPLPPSSSLDAKNGLSGPPPYPHVDSRTASPHHMSYPPSAGHPSLPPPSTLSSRAPPPPPLGPVTNGPAGALLDHRERERDRERDIMMDRERERMGGGPSSAMSSPRLGILPPSASLPPPPSKMSVPQMVDGH